MKVKIIKAGQPCRKCGKPVIKIDGPHENIKPGQKYYYKSWFRCEPCKISYMDNDAKVYVNGNAPKEKNLKGCQCEDAKVHPMFDAENNSFNLVCCLNCGKVRYE